MFEVTFSNGSLHTYDTLEELKTGVEDVFNESGMIPDYIEDTTSGKNYSCTWSVVIQEEKLSSFL